ncbi:hypothetical protein ACIQHY_21160 [Streptomyces sp. NPDC092359]|uniref:hypothetical protein n=1 Tax=Streptomyces sp. NPDC092359 TaxID=3366014 RepID=UPI0037F1557F
MFLRFLGGVAISDHQNDSQNPAQEPEADAAIRAEVRREYEARMVRAEVKAYAANSGIIISDTFVKYLDTSQFIDENGEPSTEAMDQALATFKREEPFPQLAGAGHNSGGSWPMPRPVSLDVRKR